MLPKFIFFRHLKPTVAAVSFVLFCLFLIWSLSGLEWNSANKKLIEHPITDHEDKSKHLSNAISKPNMDSSLAPDSDIVDIINEIEPENVDKLNIELTNESLISSNSEPYEDDIMTENKQDVSTEVSEMINNEGDNNNESHETDIIDTAEKTQDESIPVPTFQSFFNSIFTLLGENKLAHPLKQRSTLRKGKPVIDRVRFFRSTETRLSENDLYTFMDFPHEFIDDMTTKHRNFVKAIDTDLPDFYSGNGYVIVGGGIYTWFSILAIEALRGLNSQYPVEVFLPNKDDYEPDFCEQVLPKLNAKCVEMYKVFDEDTLSQFKISGYQYKSLALLGSSFEKVFLLDADAYPVKNPDDLFESQLFENYSMITWPDFWRRTGSPHFYKIQGKEIGNTPIRHINDIFVDPKFIKYEEESDTALSMTFHDRKGTLVEWSTESGEMLVNKKTHLKALLLSLYYNFDGPFGYYPLLSQGGPGEGDKETFVAGANYFDLPYYQVNKSPDTAYGWYNTDGRYEHTTIVQFDPITDHEILQQVKHKIHQDMEEAGDNFNYDYENYFPKFFHSNNGIPMIYHVHDPKMNPFYILLKSSTLNQKGEKIRNLGEDFPRTDFDLELVLWEAIDRHLCQEKVEFVAFKHLDVDLLCRDFTKNQISFLKESAVNIKKDYDPNKAMAQRRGKEFFV